MLDSCQQYNNAVATDGSNPIVWMQKLFAAADAEAVRLLDWETVCEFDIQDKIADHLYNELCVTLGFCFPQDRYVQIIENLPSDLTNVVNEIFTAEEINPELADRHLWRRVRDLVLKAHHDSATND